MKKSIYFILFLAVILLTGCSKPDSMASFIPTQAPSEDGDTGSDTPDETQSGEEATPTPKDIHIGNTTTMYVKLDRYGGSLNIRSTPSTTGDAVGFLVHAEEVEVIEIVDGWASIVYKDTVCYVNADFLVEERPEYLNPPTPTPQPKNTVAPTPTPTPEANNNNEAPPEI